mmetsp:Transcript_28971/g.69585  ORF Transcript_28971/g.69585 Transcript_28971/m.69585 type:complete len:158 (+) Transcript_28971:289-762(+)
MSGSWSSAPQDAGSKSTTASKKQPTKRQLDVASAEKQQLKKEKVEAKAKKEGRAAERSKHDSDTESDSSDGEDCTIIENEVLQQSTKTHNGSRKETSDEDDAVRKAKRDKELADLMVETPDKEEIELQATLRKLEKKREVLRLQKEIGDLEKGIGGV